MATQVKLQRLACQHTEDSGNDHAYLHYDGAKVWGPVKINDGQSRDVGVVRPFGTGVVDLFEEDDLDPDDHLGRIQLSADPGLHSANVVYHNHAKYTLFYEVLTMAAIAAAHSGKVLDVAGASLDNGAAVIQFDSHGGANQQWQMEDVGGGLSRIVAAHSGKVLDIAGASLDNGAPVIQFDWHGGNNQRWRVENAGGGSSRIVAAHSGKVLDIAGASLDNGAAVIQFDSHGGKNQQWRIAHV